MNKPEFIWCSSFEIQNYKDEITTLKEKIKQLETVLKQHKV
jgi:hypothetical protein